MRTASKPIAQARPFTWSVQSSEISFMRAEPTAQRGCSDCGDCGCVLPWDPPPKKKPTVRARHAGGHRARDRS